MPTFEQFKDNCDTTIKSQSVSVFLARKPTSSKSHDSGSFRELNMLGWSFGPIYAGEILGHLTLMPKPRLRDILSDREFAANFALSATACAGVLKRDEGRGRPLPPPLKAALQSVADTHKEV